MSARRLADAVEYTPGALYRYFASNDEVIEAIFDGGGGISYRESAAGRDM